MFTTEDNEIEPKDFCIDNADKANWAIEKIKEERERLSLFEQVAKNKIGELEQQIIDQKEKCNQRTANLLEKLNIYLDTVPFKKSKTQYAFELPAGKLVRKLSKRDFQKDDDSLLKYLSENAPEYLKNEPKPMWGEFKKCLSIVGDQVIRIDTGEMIDCITVVEKPGTFDVM